MDATLLLGDYMEFCSRNAISSNESDVTRIIREWEHLKRSVEDLYEMCPKFGVVDIKRNSIRTCILESGNVSKLREEVLNNDSNDLSQNSVDLIIKLVLLLKHIVLDLKMSDKFSHMVDYIITIIVFGSYFDLRLNSLEYIVHNFVKVIQQEGCLDLFLDATVDLNLCNEQGEYISRKSFVCIILSSFRYLDIDTLSNKEIMCIFRSINNFMFTLLSQDFDDQDFAHITESLCLIMERLVKNAKENEQYVVENVYNLLIEKLDDIYRTLQKKIDNDCDYSDEIGRLGRMYDFLCLISEFNAKYAKILLLKIIGFFYIIDELDKILTEDLLQVYEVIFRSLCNLSEKSDEISRILLDEFGQIMFNNFSMKCDSRLFNVKFENEGIEMIFYKLMISNICHFHKNVYRSVDNTKNEQILNQFNSKLYCLLCLSEYERLESEDVMRKKCFILTIFVKMASEIKNQKLIDQVYSFVMSQLKLECFDELSLIFVPLVRNLVTNSESATNLVDICKYYGRVFIESNLTNIRQFIINEYLLVLNSIDDQKLSIFLDFCFRFVKDVFEQLISLHTNNVEFSFKLVSTLVYLVSKMIERGSREQEVIDGFAVPIYEMWVYVLYCENVVNPTIQNNNNWHDDLLVMAKGSPCFLFNHSNTKAVDLCFGNKFSAVMKDKLDSVLCVNDGFVASQLSAEDMTYVFVYCKLSEMFFRNNIPCKIHLYLDFFYTRRNTSLSLNLLMNISIRLISTHLSYCSEYYAKILVLDLLPLLKIVSGVRDFIILLVSKYPFMFVDETLLVSLMDLIGKSVKDTFVDREMKLDRGNPHVFDYLKVKFNEFGDILDFSTNLISDCIHTSPLIMHSLLKVVLNRSNSSFLQHISTLNHGMVFQCLSHHHPLPLCQADLNSLDISSVSAFNFTWESSSDEYTIEDCKRDFESCAPEKVILSIHAINKSIFVKDQSVLDDWCDMIRSSIFNIIDKCRDMEFLKYVDPMSCKMTYGPSKELNHDEYENTLFSLNLIFSYLGEKMMYDIKTLDNRDNFSRRLNESTNLIIKILENIDVVKKARSVSFTVVTICFWIMDCYDCTATRKDHFFLRQNLIRAMIEIYTMPNVYKMSNKSLLSYEKRTIGRCRKLIYKDLLRIYDGMDDVYDVFTKSGCEGHTILFNKEDYISLYELFIYLLTLEESGDGDPSSVKFCGDGELPMVKEKTILQIIQKLGQCFPRFVISISNILNPTFPQIKNEVIRFALKNPASFLECPEILLGMKSEQVVSMLKMRFFEKAESLDLMSSLHLFKTFHDEIDICYYAVGSLRQCKTDLLVFYIPQIVQLIRYDKNGIIKKFIIETSRNNQLFAHQVIWNMLANMYSDESFLKPNKIKFILENVISDIVKSLKGEDKILYEAEFSFFNKITSISNELKNHIKKSKREKKAIIDKCLKKVGLRKDVYLPTDPNCIIVDIDYDSGKPLQSHAKAPFMVSFSVVRKDMKDRRNILTKSVIFKMGDDCRQDTLALQLISIFKEIYKTVGLNLYLYPYSVIATSSGCGIIEVIPNSISRDLLGREKINNLYDYFIYKFGSEESSPQFYRARQCFVRSLAAYSLVSYFLAIRDRHNGNIMIDAEGHIIHIDFGFILEMAPGGVQFETSPFKLTREMIQIMGDDMNTPCFLLFKELCIEAFLAIRPHAEAIIRFTSLLAESGLPCFKSDRAIKKFLHRFRLDLSQNEAKNHVCDLIKKSYDNTSTKMYDTYQYTTNSIPY